MGFPKKVWFFFKNAKSSIFVVKCDWKNRTSQIVQKIKKGPLLKKIDG